MQKFDVLLAFVRNYFSTNMCDGYIFNPMCPSLNDQKGKTAWRRSSHTCGVTLVFHCAYEFRLRQGYEVCNESWSALIIIMFILHSQISFMLWLLYTQERRF